MYAQWNPNKTKGKDKYQNMKAEKAKREGGKARFTKSKFKDFDKYDNDATYEDDWG